MILMRPTIVIEDLLEGGKVLKKKGLEFKFNPKQFN